MGLQISSRLPTTEKILKPLREGREFHKLLLSNGIKHKICVPFQPSNNDQAECIKLSVKNIHFRIIIKSLPRN